jgi:iron complex transport system ATP-binding protein
MGCFKKPEIFRNILMNMNFTRLLSFDSLKIGYRAGGHEKILLPPLTAYASKGELIAVIGKNGIGKSTLLRTIAGLQASLGGKILYNEKDINDFSRNELAQEVGYISTEIVKISNMNVYDLVSLGRFPHTNWIGKIDEENHLAIMDALEKTSMTEFSGRSISELSDGERQRAMIARIVAQDTGVMIMDEPTAFLDIGSKYEILHLMHILSRKSEKTIIFSTHDLHMAISQADKIWLILDDKLIEGSPEDLMIEGKFDHLFDSSLIKFNSDSGTFSFLGEVRESVYLPGEGLKRHWTEKALQRAGFSVSERESLPKIMIPEGTNRQWQLFTDNSQINFNSIYELICWLNTEKIRST